MWVVSYAIKSRPTRFSSCATINREKRSDVLITEATVTPPRIIPKGSVPSTKTVNRLFFCSKQRFLPWGAHE